MIPFIVPAIIARAWFCWCGGKKSMMRLIASVASTRVQRREDEVAGLGRRQRGLDGLLVAHLADEDDVRVLAQDAAQGALEGGGVHARPRAG